MELDLEELKGFVNGVESLLLSIKSGDINSKDVLTLRASLLQECEMLNEFITQAEAA